MNSDTPCKYKSDLCSGMNEITTKLRTLAQRQYPLSI